MICHLWKRVPQSKAFWREIVAVLSLRVQMSYRQSRRRTYVKAMLPGGSRPGKLAAATKALRSAARSAARSRIIAFSPQGETKYFDVSFTQTVSIAADWTGSEVPCTNYIQSDGTTVGAYTDSALVPSAVGAGYGQVVGSKYHLKKIRVRGFVAGDVGSDQADVPAPSIVRVVLVQDLRPNGAQAQGEAVFTDMGGSAQATFSFLAMGAGTGAQFKILADEFVVLQPAVAGTDGANTNSTARQGAYFTFQHIFKTPVNCFLKANSSTPTVASLSSNNIFLLAHANVGSISISGVSRAYYEG